jgi:hypothetical protein
MTEIFGAESTYQGGFADSDAILAWKLCQAVGSKARCISELGEFRVSPRQQLFFVDHFCPKQKTLAKVNAPQSREATVIQTS